MRLSSLYREAGGVVINGEISMSVRRILMLSIAAAILPVSVVLSYASPIPGVAPNYSSDATANAIAAEAAQSLTASLSGSAGYAGIRISPGGIVVSLVGKPSAVTATTVRAVQTEAAPALQAAFSGVPALPVKYETVQRSEAKLDALANRILQDAPSWRAKGIVLSTWGPDPGTNTVLVSLATYSATSAELISKFYGDAVSVNTQSMVITPSSRASDSTPWYGGSLIKLGGTSCTSWFPATRNSDSKTVMLTSAHCGTGAWKQGGATFGTTSDSSIGGRTDEQVIPVSSNAARIFSDPTSTSRRVSGVATSDPVGALLCTDGYTDREVCSVKILAIGQIVTYPTGETITGLVKAQQTHGVNAFSSGDSGGPVGATSGSDVISAYGMIAAHDTSAALGFYMPARFIQQDMGIKVKTG